MRTKRRSVTALLLVLVMVLLSGCANMTKEDAKAYTKATLDARYKGEYKKYMELTKASEKEAKKLHTGDMDAMFEGGDFNLPEEMKENYRNLYLDMSKQANYKVGEAKEAKDDAFKVDVTVKPFTGFKGIQEEVAAVVQEEVLGDLSNIPSEDEISALLFQKMYDFMAEKVAAPEYGEEKVVSVNLKPDKDGVYTISEDDMQKLGDALFPDNF